MSGYNPYDNTNNRNNNGITPQRATNAMIPGVTTRFGLGSTPPAGGGGSAGGGISSSRGGTTLRQEQQAIEDSIRRNNSNSSNNAGRYYEGGAGHSHRGGGGGDGSEFQRPRPSNANAFVRGSQQHQTQQQQQQQTNNRYSNGGMQQQQRPPGADGVYHRGGGGGGGGDDQQEAYVVKGRGGRQQQQHHHHPAAVDPIITPRGSLNNRVGGGGHQNHHHNHPNNNNGNTAGNSTSSVVGISRHLASPYDHRQPYPSEMTPHQRHQQHNNRLDRLPPSIRRPSEHVDTSIYHQPPERLRESLLSPDRRRVRGGGDDTIGRAHTKPHQQGDGDDEDADMAAAIRESTFQFEKEERQRKKREAAAPTVIGRESDQLDDFDRAELDEAERFNEGYEYVEVEGDDGDTSSSESDSDPQQQGHQQRGQKKKGDPASSSVLTHLRADVDESDLLLRPQKTVLVAKPSATVAAASSSSLKQRNILPISSSSSPSTPPPPPPRATEMLAAVAASMQQQHQYQKEVLDRQETRKLQNNHQHHSSTINNTNDKNAATVAADDSVWSSPVRSAPPPPLLSQEQRGTVIEDVNSNNTAATTTAIGTTHKAKKTIISPPPTETKGTPTASARPSASQRASERGVLKRDRAFIIPLPPSTPCTPLGGVGGVAATAGTPPPPLTPAMVAAAAAASQQQQQLSQRQVRSSSSALTTPRPTVTVDVDDGEDADMATPSPQSRHQQRLGQRLQQEGDDGDSDAQAVSSRLDTNDRISQFERPPILTRTAAVPTATALAAVVAPSSSYSAAAPTPPPSPKIQAMTRSPKMPRLKAMVVSDDDDECDGADAAAATAAGLDNDIDAEAAAMADAFAAASEANRDADMLPSSTAAADDNASDGTDPSSPYSATTSTTALSLSSATASAAHLARFITATQDDDDDMALEELVIHHKAANNTNANASSSSSSPTMHHHHRPSLLASAKFGGSSGYQLPSDALRASTQHSSNGGSSGINRSQRDEAFLRTAAAVGSSSSHRYNLPPVGGDTYLSQQQGGSANSNLPQYQGLGFIHNANAVDGHYNYNYNYNNSNGLSSASPRQQQQQQQQLLLPQRPKPLELPPRPAAPIRPMAPTVIDRSGFVNVGNSCYASSVFTMLLRNRSFFLHIRAFTSQLVRSETARVQAGLAALWADLSEAITYKKQQQQQQREGINSDNKEGGGDAILAPPPRGEKGPNPFLDGDDEDVDSPSSSLEALELLQTHIIERLFPTEKQQQHQQQRRGASNSQGYGYGAAAAATRYFDEDDNLYGSSSAANTSQRTIDVTKLSPFAISVRKRLAKEPEAVLAVVGEEAVKKEEAAEYDEDGSAEEKKVDASLLHPPPSDATLVERSADVEGWGAVDDDIVDGIFEGHHGTTKTGEIDQDEQQQQSTTTTSTTGNTNVYDMFDQFKIEGDIEEEQRRREKGEGQEGGSGALSRMGSSASSLAKKSSLLLNNGSNKSIAPPLTPPKPPIIPMVCPDTTELDMNPLRLHIALCAAADLMVRTNVKDEDANAANARLYHDVMGAAGDDDAVAAGASPSSSSPPIAMTYAKAARLYDGDIVPLWERLCSVLKRLHAMRMGKYERGMRRLLRRQQRSQYDPIQNSDEDDKPNSSSSSDDDSSDGDDAGVGSGGKETTISRLERAAEELGIQFAEAESALAQYPLGTSAAAGGTATSAPLNYQTAQQLAMQQHQHANNNYAASSSSYYELGLNPTTLGLGAALEESGFYNGEQHDAPEFLTAVLARLEGEVLTFHRWVAYVDALLGPRYAAATATPQQLAGPAERNNLLSKFPTMMARKGASQVNNEMGAAGANGSRKWANTPSQQLADRVKGLYCPSQRAWLLSALTAEVPVVVDEGCDSITTTRAGGEDSAVTQYTQIESIEIKLPPPATAVVVPHPSFSDVLVLLEALQNPLPDVRLAWPNLVFQGRLFTTTSCRSKINKAGAAAGKSAAAAATTTVMMTRADDGSKVAKQQCGHKNRSVDTFVTFSVGLPNFQRELEEGSRKIMDAATAAADAKAKEEAEKKLQQMQHQQNTCTHGVAAQFNMTPPRNSGGASVVGGSGGGDCGSGVYNPLGGSTTGDLDLDFLLSRDVLHATTSGSNDATAANPSGSRFSTDNGIYNVHIHHHQQLPPPPPPPPPSDMDRRIMLKLDALKARLEAEEADLRTPSSNGDIYNYGGEGGDGSAVPSFRNAFDLKKLILKGLKEDTIDDYKCDKCGDKSAQYVKARFAVPMPPTLLINLKRFRTEWDAVRCRLAIDKDSSAVNINRVMRINIENKYFNNNSNNVCVGDDDGEGDGGDDEGARSSKQRRQKVAAAVRSATYFQHVYVIQGSVSHYGRTPFSGHYISTFRHQSAPILNKNPAVNNSPFARPIESVIVEGLTEAEVLETFAHSEGARGRGGKGKRPRDDGDASDDEGGGGGRSRSATPPPMAVPSSAVGISAASTAVVHASSSNTNNPRRPPTRAAPFMKFGLVTDPYDPRCPMVMLPSSTRDGCADDHNNGDGGGDKSVGGDAYSDNVQQALAEGKVCSFAYSSSAAAVASTPSSTSSCSSSTPSSVPFNMQLLNVYGHTFRLANDSKVTAIGPEVAIAHANAGYGRANAAAAQSAAAVADGAPLPLPPSSSSSSPSSGAAPSAAKKSFAKPLTRKEASLWYEQEEHAYLLSYQLVAIIPMQGPMPEE